MKINRIIQSGGILVLGLTFLLSLGSQIINSGIKVSLLIGILFCVCLVGLALSYVLIYKVIWPYLINYSPAGRIKWICVSFLAGCMFVYAIPLTIYPKINVLMIEAIGEHNLLANGSEVWLRKIVAGGKAIPINMSNACMGNWQLIDEALVSHQDQPSKIFCHIKSENQISVSFGTHPWSGKVRLSLDEQIVEEDLYSITGSIKTVTLGIMLNKTQQILRLMLLFIDGMWIGIILSSICIWFVRRPIKPISQKDKKVIAWYLYALPLGICWFTYLLAFWPGFVSIDTLQQWMQVVTGQYNDWHPAFHSWTIWLITRFWNSPAAVALFDLLILSAVTGWVLYLIHSWGVPVWIRVCIILLLGLSPAIGLMTIAVWKDIPYAISVLALTVIILLIVNCEATWIKKPLSWVVLGIVVSLVALFRHNGTLVAYGSLVALGLSYPGKRKLFLYTILISLGIWLFVRGPLYQMVEVTTEPIKLGTNLAWEYRALTIIAKHNDAGTTFLPNEREMINSVTHGFKELDHVLLAELSGRTKRLAFDLTLRNPRVTIDYFLSESTYIFQIIQPPDKRIGYVELRIPPNIFGFYTESQLPIISSKIITVTKITESPKLDWFFWRNAFWMYFLLFGVIVASIRMRNWKYVLVITPLFLNAIPLIIISGGQISRYILITLLAGPLLSGYLLFIQPQKSE